MKRTPLKRGPKHKKPKPKKKKKRTPTQWEKKLDGIFSRYIRVRDSLKTTGNIYWFLCVTCGSKVHINSKNSNAGHFIERNHRGVRYDEHNVHAQCVGCNQHRKGEQYLHSLKVKEYYGEDELERVSSWKGKIYQRREPEFIDLINKYRSKLKNYTDKHGNPWRTEL